MQTQEKQKPCRVCNRVLPITRFEKKKACPDGHTNRCLDCNRRYQASVYLAKGEELREYMRLRYHRMKAVLCANPQIGKKRVPSVCGECKELLPPEKFWRTRMSPTGNSYYCKVCDKKKRAPYFERTKDSRNESKKRWTEKNAVAISARRKIAYQKIKDDPVAWKELTEKNAKRMRDKLRSNIGFRLLAAARNRLWYVAKGTAKAGRTVELIGCTPEFLKTYLESKFKPGWTWGDWGSVFEIDHIIPCSKFDMRDPEQQRKCFHYSNLQPLEKELNRSKWNKIIAA